TATVSLLIHGGLLPFLLGLGTPSLWAVVINPVAIAIFGVLLFPITIANLILPLNTLTDFLWAIFLGSSQYLANSLPPVEIIPNTIPLMAYLLGLQWVYLYVEVRNRRTHLWQ